jgi:hypothetical protein
MLKQTYPFFADHETSTSRAIPVVALTRGAPADAGEGEMADQEGGLGGGVVSELAQAPGAVVAAPVDAGLSERTKGGGVAAGFGGEVAAEAEDVGPPAQPGVLHPP